jgi:tetratricopeptide (TPR) repeat protein
LKLSHYLTIAAAVLLTVGMYYFGNTVQPAGAKPPVADGHRDGMPSGAMQDNPISVDSVIVVAKQQLADAELKAIEAAEQKAAATKDTKGKILAYKELEKVWRQEKNTKIAAFYNSETAKLENTENALTFAARLFLRELEDEENGPMRSWEARIAAECLEQAKQLNPNDEEIKLGLATCYLEGTGEPMRGVQILLGIVNAKPNDIPANLMLGKMSVRSGQLDKAIGRFETVLKQEPANTEALYYLGQVYKGKGDNKKAIEMLERCKASEKDPQLESKIDQEINSLK